MQEALIVAAVRTPIGKAPRGTLRQMRSDDLAALVLQAALDRVPGLTPAEVEDVILGSAMPEAEQGMNLARIAVLRAGWPASVAGVTVNRFCASGLEAVAQAALRVQAGLADVIVAGGAESMSQIPLGGHKFAPNPWLTAEYPAAYIGMGHTAEEVARRFGVGRDVQDAFALESHRRAWAAWEEGRFDEEVVPVPVRLRAVDAQGRPSLTETVFSRDEGPRVDTSADKLAALPPVFHREGSVTAGNSSQTSDGAAACVVMSARRAQALGVRALAAFRGYAVAGVEPEIMGVGPVAAIPKVLRLAGLHRQDVRRYELNEAFAAQAVCVMRLLELDPARVNPKGGAIALGHPLGCTGARQVATLLPELARSGGGYGVVSMCVGGGMGAAAVFEGVDAA